MKNLKKFGNFEQFKQYQYNVNNYTTPIVSKTNEGLIYKKKDPYNCPYQRIKYVEDSGDSEILFNFDGITNDIIANNKLEYVTNLQLTSLDNGAEGKNNTYFFIGINGKYYYSGCGSQYRTSSTVADLNKHELKLSVENNIVNYYLDNNIIDTYSFGTGFRDTLDVFKIFNCYGYNGGLHAQRKSYTKLSLGNRIIFECLPVRVGNIGYMYETVSKQLYRSDNLDHPFILGPDIT